jgi:hypothetical protein
MALTHWDWADAESVQIFRKQFGVPAPSCTLLAACLTYLTNTLAQGERDALLQRAGGPGGGEEAERLRAVVARLRSELLRKEAALGAAVADLEKVRDSLLDRHKSSVFSVYLKKLRLTV